MVVNIVSVRNNLLEMGRHPHETQPNESINNSIEIFAQKYIIYGKSLEKCVMIAFRINNWGLIMFRKTLHNVLKFSVLRTFS